MSPPVPVSVVGGGLPAEPAHGLLRSPPFPAQRRLNGSPCLEPGPIPRSGRSSRLQKDSTGGDNGSVRCPGWLRDRLTIHFESSREASMGWWSCTAARGITHHSSSSSRKPAAGSATSGAVDDSTLELRSIRTASCTTISKLGRRRSHRIRRRVTTASSDRTRLRDGHPRRNVCSTEGRRPRATHGARSGCAAPLPSSEPMTRREQRCSLDVRCDGSPLRTGPQWRRPPPLATAARVASRRCR